MSSKAKNVSNQIREKLKSSALKATEARLGVLNLFHEEHGPFSAEIILKKMPKDLCDPATLYRMLLQFEKAKLISTCDFGDGIQRYELAHEDSDHHHHHLICKKCKQVETIDAEKIEKEIERLPKKFGFKDVTHRLEFFGICPTCQKV